MWKSKSKQQIDDVAYIQVEDLTKSERTKRYLYLMDGHLLVIQA